jgi:photosystem II stability/assembly factor-like uncharacterized protein
LDGGENWQTIAQPPTDWTNAITISPHSRQTILLGGRGFWISTDGGVSWNERISGLGAENFELFIDPMQNSRLFIDIVADCQLYQSDDGGRAWEIMEDRGCQMSMNRDGTVWYWTDGQMMFFSTDSGATWKENELPEKVGGEYVVAHPAIAGRVYILEDRENSPTVYVSPDFGATWHAALGTGKLVSGRLFFDHDLGQRIYAISSGFEAYVSSDVGETWEACAPIKYVSYSNSRMAVSPVSADHLILATRGDGILVSLDGCQSWQASNTGLGSLFVNTLAIDPNNPDTVYAGTDGGAYVSYDFGKSWHQINDGLLGALVIYSIVVDKDSNVYAATPYGIFKLGNK